MSIIPTFLWEAEMTPSGPTEFDAFSLLLRFGRVATRAGWMASVKKIKGKTGTAFKITVTAGRDALGKQKRYYKHYPKLNLLLQYFQFVKWHFIQNHTRFLGSSAVLVLHPVRKRTLAWSGIFAGQGRGRRRADARQGR